MNSVEDAYQEIAKSIIDFISGRPWDYGVFESEIYSSMTKSIWYLVYDG